VNALRVPPLAPSTLEYQRMKYVFALLAILCVDSGGGANATINESYRFPLAREDILTINMFNHRGMRSDALIGTARVSLREVRSSKSETMSVQLQDDKDYGAGVVDVELKIDGVRIRYSIMSGICQAEMLAFLRPSD
jgi:hypothetical protein